MGENEIFFVTAKDRPREFTNHHTVMLKKKYETRYKSLKSSRQNMIQSKIKLGDGVVSTNGKI